MSKDDDPEVKETPAEKAAAERAQKSWERYQQVGVDAENKYMANVDQMKSDWQHNVVAGESSKALTEKFDQASDSLALNEFNSGADPSSGRFQGNQAGLSEAKVSTVSDTLTEGAQLQHDRHAANLGNVVAMGSNQSTTATMGLNDLARRESSAATTSAINDYKDNADDRELAGMATGAGLSMAMSNRG